ncbi:MAG: cbb3-type cytochrome c oxidase subunit I [Deltaproteobacteria bacterium]|nr:cbb3-type cytochrome c oxidase subunit I [Deltaproteobacteria bacterium]
MNWTLTGIKVNPQAKKLAYAWLLFAVSTLIFAGIFAFLVAMARTPVIQDFLPKQKDYFYIALVGHVDLAVVIWFLAFMGVLWTLSMAGFSGVRTDFKTAWAGFVLSAVGTLLITITALFGLGSAIIANYIPIISHPLFYAGIIMFAAGLLITVADAVITVIYVVKNKVFPEYLPVVSFGMFISAVTVIAAMICFSLAFYFLKIPSLHGAFFERLFWGGGHILQFVNTIGMVLVWLLLTNICLKTMPLTERFAKLLLLYYLVFVIPSPLLFFMYNVHSQAYKDAFTKLMQFGLGPSTIIFAFFILKTMWCKHKTNEIDWKDPGISSLAMSVVMFAMGGVISLFIHGINVKIPSHYHGVIGGVTLAFMGLAYHMLSLFDRDITFKKLAKIQPYLYGIGQILFVVGLFLAGAHGVQRKTFGVEQNLDSIMKMLGMSIMGIGGLVAILGGGAFVINMLVSMVKKPSESGRKNSLNV